MHSAETREKIRQKALGRKHTPEARQKMSESRRGKAKSESFKRALSVRMRGTRNPCYKQGKKIIHGYVHLLRQEHPYSVGGYVKEHRLVMEDHIQRVLSPEEVVHHINGDISDNSIDNLMLFPNNVAHLRHHAQLRAGRGYKNRTANSRYHKQGE